MGGGETWRGIHVCGGISGLGDEKVEWSCTGASGHFSHPCGPPPRRFCLGADASPPDAAAADAEGFLPSPQQMDSAGSARHSRTGRRASEACIASPSGGGAGGVEAGWALAMLRRMHSARFLVTAVPVDEVGGEGSGSGGFDAGSEG